MKIKVEGFEIKLDDAELADCRKHIGKILEDVNKISMEANRPGYYLTFLICMNMISGKALKELDLDVIDLILNKLPGLMEERNDDNNL